MESPKVKVLAVSPKFDALDPFSPVYMAFVKIGAKTTVCVITLTNGYEVTGTSACIDPADYREDLGMKYAQEDAQDKIEHLKAFHKQTQLMIKNANQWPDTFVHIYPEEAVLPPKDNDRDVEVFRYSKMGAGPVEVEDCHGRGDKDQG